MAWTWKNTLGTTLGVVSMIPFVGVVGSVGGDILAASEDPELLKDGKFLTSSICSAALCFVPGGGAAKGAVKIARIGLEVADRGAGIAYAADGVNDIYEHGLSAGSLTSVLAAASGGGRVGHIAHRATLATGSVAMAENAVHGSASPQQATPEQDEKKRVDTEIAALRKKEAEEHAPPANGINAGAILGTLLFAVASSMPEKPAKPVGNQVEGKSATGIDSPANSHILTPC